MGKLTKDSPEIVKLRNSNWPEIIELGEVPEEMSLKEATFQAHMAWAICMAGKELPQNGNFGKGLASYSSKFGIDPRPENLPVASNFNKDGDLITH